MPRRSKKIERLQLCSPGIGDNGLGHLKGLTNLNFLNTGKSNITDAGLKQLANLNKLNRIIIRGGHFTDESLKFLQKLPALETLDLTSDTAFSNEAIQNLKNNRPDINLKLKQSEN